MLSDDDTRTEFARMREAVLHDIIAPGPAAAHRTVRLRRRRAAAASSGLAVLTVAGGIALARPSPPPAPAPVPESPAAVTSTTVTPSPQTPPTSEVLVMRIKDHGITGPQRFDIVCSGTATGRATLKSETQSTTVKVTCGTPSASTRIELDVQPPRTTLELSIDWDAGARPTGSIHVLGVEQG